MFLFFLSVISEFKFLFEIYFVRFFLSYIMDATKTSRIKININDSGQYIAFEVF